MPQNKILISTEEVAEVSALPDSGVQPQPQLRSPVPLFAKVALAPLVLILPVLSITAIAVRLYIRRHEPRVQHAWIRYLCSLLVVSGLATTALLGGSLLWSRSPMRAVPPDSHALDTISVFPDVQQPRTRTVQDLANAFRKTVFVVAQQPKWGRLSREDLGTVGFGSGVLVFAGRSGYLVLSSRHVIDGFNWQQSRPFAGNVALAPEEGDLTSAKIAGRHRNLDLILLRVDRRSGNSTFVQPVVDYANISLGERILVFGHPEGFFFSVSDGIVSRKDGAGLIQITAPVSPGASGGPVYDLQGRLLGIVSWMVDKQRVPLSENLNFAVRADTLLRPEDWILDPQGTQLMKEFLAASQNSGNNARPSVSSPSKPPIIKSTPTKPN